MDAHPRMQSFYQKLASWPHLLIFRLIQDLIEQLHSRFSSPIECLGPSFGEGIVLAFLAFDDLAVAGEETFFTQAVQRGIEGAAAEVVAVPGELVNHPKPVHELATRPVEDVELDEAQEQITGKGRRKLLYRPRLSFPESVVGESSRVKRFA